ncbi:MAG TPA: sigma 54-interacting transcriptional regulator [Candidatus Binatia bacterium]|nr:sigma 54-interacting transcriptional regulator [Candidatus Binatia bacterium]
MDQAQPRDAILGASNAIIGLREQVGRLASFDAVGNPHVPTVLLQGETGTGKGLVARTLHESGPRARHAFIDVNCAAIPDTMLEAELFGFEAGAFTDARRAKQGLFEAASAGTLFLDEIDSLSLALQAKLLKAIEEKTVRRLGAVGTRRVDVKLIAATQHDLETLVAEGGFRADLYHRLAVLVLRIPPLRERGEDAVVLAQHLLHEFARAHGLAPRRLGEDAKRWLRAHPWPGNVRELSHLIERATLLGPEGDLDAAALEALSTPLPAARGPAPASIADPDRGLGRVPSRAEIALEASMAGGSPLESAPAAEADERRRIGVALARSGGNVVAAARLLGVGRNALRYRMRRLGIEKPSLDDLALAPATAGRAATLPEIDSPPHGPLRADAPARAPDRAAVVRAPAAAAARWEQKRAATLVVDLVFPAPGEGDALYEPWTAAARWRAAVAEKLRGFGGVLLDGTASRVTAAFGIPRALEQTAQRALQAALAVQVLARTAAQPRPDVRVAIHAGEVRFDGGASDEAPRVLPIGDAIAFAERLIGHAGAGEILVSPRVARQVRGACSLEARALRLGPRPEDEVAVYAATPRARAPQTSAEVAGGTAFVGRQRELALLEDALRSADAGHGQVVFLAGEAGIGKSRLLLEFRSRLRDRPHLWVEGRCASYGGTTPFFPVVDGLRRLFGIDDRDDEAAAGRKIELGVAAFGDDLAWTLPYVRQVLSLSAGADAATLAALDSASRRSETFRAMRALLVGAAQSQPVVLVVEDLHWIDHTSEDFLAFVASVVPTIRVLLVCSHRPGYAHPFGDRSYHHRLTVLPLDDGEMAAMTRSLLGTSDMPDELRALIAHKAEGNPFFVEEVMRSLLEDGSLEPDGEHVVLKRDLSEIRIPDTVQEVLTARIDHLADEARRAIQVASVIGREFALRLLERITDAGDEVRAQLEELRSVELIYEKALHPELAYMFKHALTHDVAYQSVVSERRRALHRTIGLAIEELYADRLEEHYETLAHHFARAEEWQRALTYHERAVAKAADRHATRAVVQHCREALAIADRLGEDAPRDVRERLEASLGLACFYLSDFSESGAAYERAARAAADPQMSGLYETFASQSYFWAHEYDHAWRIVDDVLREPAARPDGAVAMAYNLRGFGRAVLDADMRGAERDYATALETSRGRFGLVEAHVRFNQTLFAEWTGDYARAIALAEEVMKVGRELRLAHLVVWPYWFLGKARCCLGDYGGAIAQLEEGYQICDRIADRAWKSRLLNTLGWCLGEIGCHERAREVDERAAEVARQLGDPEIMANSEINLALDELAAGRTHEAERFLEPYEKALAEDPWMRWRYSLHVMNARASLALAAGDPAVALAAAEREAAGAVRHDAPKIEARALLSAGRALLEVERWDDADARLARALAVADRIAAPRLAWRAHALLARVRQARGDREAAERHVAAHRRLVDAAAASLRDAALRRRLYETADAETGLR